MNSLTLASRLAATLAIAAGCSTLRADIFFSETNFNPGSWSAAPTYLGSPALGGASFSAVSNPLAVPGGPMRQDFTLTLPSGSGFNVIYAPILFTGWTYDPSVSGTIATINASARTLPQQAAPPGFGSLRFFLLQDGKQYVLDSLSPNHLINYPNFTGHNVSDPELVRTATSLVPTDFIRVIPDNGFDFADHPNYAGGPMSFGFGYSLTTSEVPHNGLAITIPASFDDVSVRITTVPAPSAACLLGLIGLSAARRRR